MKVLMSYLFVHAPESTSLVQKAPAPAKPKPPQGQSRSFQAKPGQNTTMPIELVHPAPIPVHC